MMKTVQKHYHNSSNMTRMKIIVINNRQNTRENIEQTESFYFFLIPENTTRLIALGIA